MAAVITEPRSASPALRMTEWDEAVVQRWLTDLGLGQYEDRIYEHGITGEVLAALDHEALQDLGITSLGHRLNILRAVYELKIEQGIEVSDDDWRPKEDGGDKLRDAIQEMRNQISQFQRWQNALLDILENSGIVVDTSLPSLSSSALASSTASTQSAQPSSSSTSLERTVLDRRNPPPNPPASVVPPVSAGLDTYTHTHTPTSSGANPFDSPSLTRKNTYNSPGPAPLSRSGNLSVQGAGSGTSASSSTAAPTKAVATLAASSSVAPASTPSALDDATKQRDARRAKDEAHSTARSFRVTMDDPCFKVLPAALKKYRINDDWRKYALFITIDGVPTPQPDRCLAYDEKPLLLYQKIKESGARPTFMLRHVRDIRNPIALANCKQLLKAGFPIDSTQNMLPTLEATSPTRRLAPSQRNDDGTAGGAFPEQPSPGLGGGTTYAPGTVVDSNGNVQRVTYAVAIYPYIKDRADEFDVAVGSTYVVLSKTKGWWIVQKDPDALGKITPDPTQSGWVPAGCLIETSVPIGASAPPDCPPGRAPFPASACMSSSHASPVLMDYQASTEDELSVRVGEVIRVYKKYAHWAYAIKEGGQRGWVPQFYLSKNPMDSQPSTAVATPGAGAPADTAPYEAREE
ncbi:hypothetical protein Q5752_001359 [Cryptotrichosporon argae]